MTDFIIKKGTPPPKRNSIDIFPFSKMGIGEYFEVPYGEERAEKVRKRVINNARLHIPPDFYYTTRHNTKTKTIEFYRITKEEFLKRKKSLEVE